MFVIVLISGFKNIHSKNTILYIFIKLFSCNMDFMSNSLSLFNVLKNYFIGEIVLSSPMNIKAILAKK